MSRSDRHSLVSTTSSRSTTKEKEDEDVKEKPIDPMNPNNLTDEEKLEAVGKAFSDGGGAVYIGLIAQEIFSPHVSPEAIKKAMEQIHAQCGNSTDPIERMMVEQLTLANHSIGRLMVKSASADNFEQAAMYQASATKLLAEFRRLALSIKKYREPSSTSQFVVIKQQNNAGAQQIAFVEGEEKSGMLEAESGKSFLRNELVSNEVPQRVHLAITEQKSTPSSGRSNEPKETKRTERRGPKGSS